MFVVFYIIRIIKLIATKLCNLYFLEQVNYCNLFSHLLLVELYVLQFLITPLVPNFAKTAWKKHLYLIDLLKDKFTHKC